MRWRCILALLLGGCTLVSMGSRHVRCQIRRCLKLSRVIGGFMKSHGHVLDQRLRLGLALSTF